MAADVYINTTEYSVAKNKAGEGLKCIVLEPKAIVADAVAGDLYRLATLPLDATLVKVELFCSALTTAADNDLGLYRSKLGAVADADILMDGQSFASASKALDGLQTVSTANSGKNLGELYAAINSSGTAFDGEKFCDIGLAIKTAATVDGYIGGRIYYM